MGVFTGTAQEIADKKRAIEQTRMSMFMTATEHQIEINDQGNLNLTIEYTSWQEVSLDDSDSDILATAQTRAARETRREKLLAADPCDAEAFTAIEAEYAETIEEENYSGWQRLLKELNDAGDIFVLRVPEDKLREYYAAELGEGYRSTQGLANLLVRGDVSRCPSQDPLDFTLVPDQADNEAIDQALSSAPGNDNDTILERTQRLSWVQAEGSSDVNVQYFFFGDLLEAALRLISRPQASEDGVPIAPGKMEKDMRVLLGPLTFLQSAAASPSGAPELVYDINLADIPISVHYFIEWFLGDVIGQQRTTYPCMLFIKNVASKLITPVIVRHCKDFANVERQRFELRTNFLSAAAVSSPGTRSGPGDPVNSYKNVLGDQRVDVDKAYSDVHPPDGPGRLLTVPLPGERPFHYLLIYTLAAPSLGGLDGTFTNDQLKGIYHFGIGKNKGILKSVQFSKTDFSLREARMEREMLENATGLAILANVYNIKIKMFGNTIFAPGSIVYVDPSGLGQIGLPTDPDSPARMLGIGGYHAVYNVQSFIESGKYETVIDARWEAPGDTTGGTAFERQARAAAAGRCPDGSRPRSVLRED